MKKQIKEEKIQLRPSPNCKVCYGRGWNLVSRPDTDLRIQEVRPCVCVKAVVKVQPDPSSKAEHYVLIPLLRDR